MLKSLNKMSTETIFEIKIPRKYLTIKGTISRVPITSWVKKAVFHRDKGRFVFCNTDLTGLVNPLTNSNYPDGHAGFIWYKRSRQYPVSLRKMQ